MSQSEKGVNPASADAAKYHAFLSYSHRDAKVSTWLHRALETYRLPARLVGRATRDGVVPQRLYPVFRDTDELSSSAELNDGLREALAKSRFLVVVCSPAAATSRWVDEEIRLFKAMGGEQRVLAVIAAGEPNAGDTPGCDPALECFPPALRHAIGPDGRITDRRTEPIAADLRPGHGGRGVALLRIIAGVAGIGFDELRQRDRARRQVRRLWSAVGAAVGIALIAVGLFRYDVERRLSDFEERGRKELIAQQPARAAAFLSEAYRLGNRSSDLRFMLWQAMQDVETFVASAQWAGWKVTDVAFTPDGSRLLVLQRPVKTGEKGIVRILEPKTLREIGMFEPQQPLRRIEFDPASGALLFAAGGTFGRLEATTGKLIDSVPISSNAKARMAFAVAGRVAVVTAGETASVVDLDGNRVIRTLTQPGDLLLPAVSADGEWLLLANGIPQSGGKYYANHVALWRLADGSRHRDFESAADLFDWRFAPSGARFVLAERAGTVTVHDPTIDAPVVRLRHPQGLWTTQWSPDGETIGTAGLNGTVYLWNARDGEVRLAMHGHASGARAIRFLTGTDRLLTTSSDGTLRVWDKAVGKGLAVFDASHGLYPSAAVSHDETAIVSFSSGDETLKLWNPLKVKPLTRLQVAAEGVPIEWMSVSNDGRRFVGTPRTGDVDVWDAVTGKRLVRVPVAELPPTSGMGDNALLSADGSRVMTGLGIWDVERGARIVDFPFDTTEPGLMGNDWDRDGKRAAYVAKDGTTTVVDVASGKALSTFRAEPAASVSIGLDGARVAVTTADGVAVFDASTGTETARFRSPGGEGQLPLLAGDGRHLLSYDPLRRAGQLFDLSTNAAVASIEASAPANWTAICDRRYVGIQAPQDKAVDLYDLATGRLVVTLKGRSYGLVDISCDPASGRVATGSTDGMTRIWRLADGVLLSEFSTHGIASGGAQYADGGRRLLTSGFDGTVAVWELREETRSPDDVRRSVACRVPWRIVGRELVEASVDAAACR